MPQRASAISSVSTRLDLLVLGRGEEDVRAPVEPRRPVDEARPRLDEVALELDAEPGLLERLALYRLDEVLARLDPAAGRPPDARGEGCLRISAQPIAVEDEERDVVQPRAGCTWRCRARAR